MAVTFEEFQLFIGKFPSLAETPESDLSSMFVAFEECERENDSELMDFFKYRFWEKTPAERAEYLTRRQYAHIAGLVNDRTLAAQLDDKARFYEWFKPYLGRDYVIAREGEHAHFLEMCAAGQRLVVKPRRSGYGRGIEIRDTNTPRQLWRECTEGKAIVEGLIVQHPDLARLYPKSVNSARVATAIGRSGEVRVVSAALRCGRGGSITDSGDPFIAGIDLATGAVVTDGISHYLDRAETHPDSGTRFRDVTVPNWDGLLEQVRKVATENPNLRLMNWDWACREDGTWCLVEGNFFGGIGPCQEAFGTGLARKVCEALDMPQGGLDA